MTQLLQNLQTAITRRQSHRPPVHRQQKSLRGVHGPYSPAKVNDILYGGSIPAHRCMHCMRNHIHHYISPSANKCPYRRPLEAGGPQSGRRPCSTIVKAIALNNVKSAIALYHPFLICGPACIVGVLTLIICLEYNRRLMPSCSDLLGRPPLVSSRRVPLSFNTNQH